MPWTKARANGRSGLTPRQPPPTLYAGVMGARLDRLVAGLRARLGSPRAGVLVVALSVLAVASSLGAGMAADDHFHQLLLRNDPRWALIQEPWYELFTFFDGDPARNRFYIERGLTVWWTDLDIVGAFFRPVAAATHLIDARLWPSAPWLMHLHSIAWYAALVAAATWVYRRLFAEYAKSTATWAAGLAALFYGFDHNHAIPVGWIANRNAIVAAFFAVCCLGAYDLAVRAATRRPAWSLASAVLLALALGSGESGLGTLGFIAAHALFLDGRSWRARAVSLAPLAVVSAIWAVVYRAGGFGVRGSGMYLEPLREPLRLAGFVVRHLPLLVASELGGPTPDVYPFLPTAGRVVLVLVAVAVLAWAASAALRLWRAEPLARFFLAGGVLAALPACATFPGGRLLTIAGFGLLGLVALVGAGVADAAPWVPARPSKLVRSFAIWACGGHLVLSPLILQLTTGQLGRIGRFLDGLGAQVPASVEDRGRRVVIMNAPDTLLVAYILIPRQLAGDPVPERMLMLGSGSRALEIARRDTQTVVVHAPGGFYRSGTELVTRNGGMPVGTRVELSDVTIEITRVCDDGVPDEATFRFARSADDGAFLWRRWEGTRLLDVRPPAVGERIAIPGALPPVF
jgi:hypothetical protein